MEIIKDINFQNSLEENLTKIPKEAKKDFQKIKETFSLKKVYILGGFVRDSIIEALYGYSLTPNDLDILVDDENFEEKKGIFCKKDFSRFGGLKLKYPNFSIDLFGMQNIFFLKNNPELNKTLENVLKGVDLSTSALAFNLSTKKFYSYKAIDDILRKEVNLKNQSYIEVGPTICRLILHSNKMNFKIGKSGKDYIQKNYNSKVNESILNYLDYKNLKSLFPFVKDSIDFILK